MLMASSIPRRHPISLKTSEANWGPLLDMPLSSDRNEIVLHGYTKFHF